MTIFLIYAIVVLIAFSAVVSRYSGRRLNAVRIGLASDEEALRTTERSIMETRHAQDRCQRRIAGLDEDLAGARHTLALLERRLAEAREAPVERHFVFDRLEPRAGLIWTAEVRRVPDPAVPQRQVAAWGAPRDVLIVAASHAEAMERLSQRFPRQAGFTIGRIAPSPLFDQRNAGVVAGAANEGDGRSRPAGRARAART